MATLPWMVLQEVGQAVAAAHHPELAVVEAILPANQVVGQEDDRQYLLRIIMFAHLLYRQNQSQLRSHPRKMRQLTAIQRLSHHHRK